MFEISIPWPGCGFFFRRPPSASLIIRRIQEIIHRILQTNSCFRDKVRINNDDYDSRQFYRINIRTYYYYNNTKKSFLIQGKSMAEIVFVCELSFTQLLHNFNSILFRICLIYYFILYSFILLHRYVFF